MYIESESQSWIKFFVFLQCHVISKHHIDSCQFRMLLTNLKLTFDSHFTVKKLYDMTICKTMEHVKINPFGAETRIFRDNYHQVSNIRRTLEDN